MSMIPLPRPSLTISIDVENPFWMRECLSKSLMNPYLSFLMLLPSSFLCPLFDVKEGFRFSDWFMECCSCSFLSVEDTTRASNWIFCNDAFFSISCESFMKETPSPFAILLPFLSIISVLCLIIRITYIRCYIRLRKQEVLLCHVTYPFDSSFCSFRTFPFITFYRRMWTILSNIDFLSRLFLMLFRHWTPSLNTAKGKWCNIFFLLPFVFPHILLYRLKRATDTMFGGKQVVVCGYGEVSLAILW